MGVCWEAFIGVWLEAFINLFWVTLGSLFRESVSWKSPLVVYIVVCWEALSKLYNRVVFGSLIVRSI